MYRNPYMDDPRVKGLSRSTANTHVINHKGLILALKEDSPPVAHGPQHARDGGSGLHLRRPAAAYRAVHRASEGLLEDRQHRGLRLRGRWLRQRHASVLRDRQEHGKKVWEAKIKVPYCRTAARFRASPRTTSRSSWCRWPMTRSRSSAAASTGPGTRSRKTYLGCHAPLRRRQGPQVDRRARRRAARTPWAPSRTRAGSTSTPR